MTTLSSHTAPRSFTSPRPLPPPTHAPPRSLPFHQNKPTFATQDPMQGVLTKFVHSSINKIKFPVNVVCWTPDGRRLLTGSTSGEFTLWNGLTFNFETLLQAHDSAIRSMVWSPNSNFMITADNNGIIKYWQSNMNNVKAWQAHKEIIRDMR